MVLERFDPFAKGADALQKCLHRRRYEYARKEVRGIVLDVGCGFGYGFAMLQRMGNSVIALDVSDVALSYAKRNYRGPQYIKADAQWLPFKREVFDSIIALELIEHFDNGKIFLQEIHRILKKRGRLILSTYNLSHLVNRIKTSYLGRKIFRCRPKNPYHKHEYTSKELIKLIESSGFQILKIRGQMFYLPLIFKLPFVCICKYVDMVQVLPTFNLHIILKAQKIAVIHK